MDDDAYEALLRLRQVLFVELRSGRPLQEPLIRILGRLRAMGLGDFVNPHAPCTAAFTFS